MDQETRNILVGMKAELSNGWIQGELQNEKGVCLYGAVVRAGDLPYGRSICGSKVKGRSDPSMPNSYFIDFQSAAGKAIQAIANEVGVEWEDLALWQDDPARTPEEVVAVIDRVLLKESEEIFATAEGVLSQI